MRRANDVLRSPPTPDADDQRERNGREVTSRACLLFQDSGAISESAPPGRPSTCHRRARLIAALLALLLMHWCGQMLPPEIEGG